MRTLKDIDGVFPGFKGNIYKLQLNFDLNYIKKFYNIYSFLVSKS